ncbi:hypothetical protein V2O64_20480 [Verrucomicrobiaceae bacterium 227]
MSQFEKPAGHFAVPLIIFGFVSLLLGVATELMGVFGGLTESLREACLDGGLIFTARMGLPDTAGILVTAAGVFGVIAAILGTPGGARRVILGFSALLLTFALIPAFAVWGIFWKPFGMIIAILWGWLSASLYAHSHRMPCEGVLELPAENVIDLDGGLGVENYKRHSDGQS